jgi:phage-related protein
LSRLLWEPRRLQPLCLDRDPRIVASAVSCLRTDTATLALRWTIPLHWARLEALGQAWSLPQAASLAVQPE